MTDAASNTLTQTSYISIGFPGNQHVSLTWSPSTFGINIPVSFQDNTSGGYLPYFSWQWIYGKELYTNSQPTNTNGDTRETRINWGPDYNFSGDPQYPVTFPVYGIYPVTLIVTDNAGFNVAKTVNILVDPATKCLSLTIDFLSPYPNLDTWWSDEPRKMKQTDSPYFYYWDACGAYYNWGCDYCMTHFGDDYYTDQTACITDTRWKLRDENNNIIDFGNHSMPNDWLQHPGQNYGTWFYWYDDNDPEHDNHSLLAGCYPNGSFPHKGRYYVTFEAYNRFASPNQSSGTPATKDNYSMYNALEVPYYVVDCSEAHTVNQNFVRVLILQFMPVPLILAQPLMSRLLQVLQLHVNLVHHP